MGRHGHGEGWKQALASLLILVNAQALLMMSGRAPVLDGRLYDPDCYMHLQRARQMLEGGLPRLPVDGRIDAPLGGVLHWTSLFDLLLVAGARPLLALGLDVDDAVFAWGTVISPLMLVAVLPVLAWGFRTLLPGAMLPLAMLLLMLQGQLAGAFQIGRPDHQSLLLAGFLAELACLAAILEGRAGAGAALAAGLAQGLALWCSVEGLLFLLVSAPALCFAWLRGRAPGLALLRLHAMAALAVVVVGLGWEDPAGPMLVSQARPSLVHALALAGGVAALWLARPFEKHAATPRARLGLLAATAGVAAAPVLSVFPDFIRGPWGRLDAGLSAWHDEVDELRPLLPTTWPRLMSFLAQFAIPLAALPLLLHRLRRGGATLWPLLPAALAVALFAPLALAQGRWTAYVQAALLVPATLTVCALWRRHRRLRTPAFAAVLAVQMGATSAVRASNAIAPGATAPGATCDWSAAARFLATQPGDGRIVLTDLYAGPEILWRSRFRVVAGPYELAEANRDTNTVLRGAPAAATEVLRRRAIDEVLLCQTDASADGALAAALRTGPQPGFTPLAAPAGFVRYIVR